MLGVAGEISTRISVACDTVSVVEPLTVPSVAVMVGVPTDMVVAKPWSVVPLEIVAAPDDELQVTMVVTSGVELSS